MGTKILGFSIYESVIAIVFGLLATYFAVKVIEKMILKISLGEIVQSKNYSTGIFAGALLYCFLELTVISIYPSVQYLQQKLYLIKTLEIGFYLMAFLVFLLSFFASFLISAIALLTCTKIIFTSTKKIDEIKEIVSNNNLSLSVFLSFTLIGFTYFIKPSLGNLLKSMIGLL